MVGKTSFEVSNWKASSKANIWHCKFSNRDRAYIFSLAVILTNFGKCCLQPENLEKLIFVSKNWLNNPKVGCKEASSFVEFIKREENFEEELEEFEGECEREEIENCKRWMWGILMLKRSKIVLL